MANFPTLSQNPQFPIEEETEDSTLRSSFEGGYVHTRPKYTRIRHIWSIKYKNLSTADKEMLATFVNITVRGAADSFTWTHPQSSTSYTVRFQKSPKYSSSHYNNWDVDFQLEEV